MDEKKIAAVLAEEIRTNGELRRQFGMSEGANSELIEEDGNEIGMTTDEGEIFFIKVDKG